MKRYSIYSYLEHDTPSGEPMDAWEVKPESDGEWVKFDDVKAMLRDFDNAISIVEQEYPDEADRHKLVTAMRKRWFP